MGAYAVTVQALKFPNEAPTWELILKFFYEPYWNLFGELFEDDGESMMNFCEIILLFIRVEK